MNACAYSGGPQGASIRPDAAPAEPAVARIARSLLAVLVFSACPALGADRTHVNLRGAHPVEVDYGGTSESAATLSSASPRAIAFADFDRNGTPDLVTGYATHKGGIVTMQRGNPDAFAPLDDAVFPRFHQGYDPASLLPRAEVHAVPASPDFLVTGTFADGAGRDVLIAERGAGLYLLQGDGNGGWAPAREIRLPGTVTALASGEFRAADGKTDVAIGVATPAGAALLVFDGATGFADAVLALPVSAPVVAIELGGLDDDPFLDLVAVADREMLVVHGWGRAVQAKAEARVERIAVAPGIRGLALGEFVWDRDGRLEIATLASDGTVRIVRGADLDLRPFDEAEKAQRTRGRHLGRGSVVRDVEAMPSWQPKGAAGWVTADAFKASSAARIADAVAKPLLRANLLHREADDLLVIGGHEAMVEVVHEIALQPKASGDERRLKRTTMPLDGAPVAIVALPAKLNGVRDFVVLDAVDTRLTTVPQAPKAIISVDRTDDTNAAGAQACTAAANDCSLRGAISFSNLPANAGSTINIPAGTYVLDINGGGAVGCDGNATGDLAANQSMNLVGAGAGNTIIRQTGTGPGLDGDRIMCMNEVFALNLQYQFSALTFVGGREGTAGGTGSSIGGAGIIGGEFNNGLTLTNTVFTNNQATRFGDANIGGGGIQITGGNLTITNSTFGGTNAPPGYADRSSTNAGNSQAGSGGGVMFTPSSPMHAGGTGVLTVTGSTFRQNRAGSTGSGGAGADLVTFAFASPGGIGSGSADISGSTFEGNQALPGNGGGILVESLATTVATTSITNNAAGNRGGAIYVAGGGLTLNGAVPSITMAGNTAGSAGSSISTAFTVNVTGTNTTLGGDIEVTTGGVWTNNTGSTLAPTNVVVQGGTFVMNNSTMNVGGNLLIAPAPIVGGIFNANSGTINIAGNLTFTNGGTPASALNAGTSTFNFNGTGGQSISNAASIAFNHLTDSNNTQPLQLNNSLAVNGNFTLNGAGTVVRPVPAAIIGGAGTLTGTGRVLASRNFATADFLTQWTIANKTLTQLTVEYSGAGDQTVNHAPTYSHLVISNGGLKTLQGNTTLTGSLTIAASAALASGNFGLDLAGDWTNNAAFTPGTGTVTFNGTSGTQGISGNTTFYNLTLANPGATTNFGTTTTTIQNDLVANAGTMAGGTSTITFTGGADNAGAIGGAAAKNFHNLTISSPATVTNSAGGSVTIEGDLAVTGQFVQAAALGTTFATDDSADGLHGMSGGGATTFGTLSVDASNSLDAGTHDFSVVGASLAVAGTLTGGNTVSLTGAAGQSISGNGSKSFNDLTINNANGVSVLNGTQAVDASVAGVLTLTTDLTVAPGAVLRQFGTSAGAADVLGTVRRTDLGATTRAFGNADNQITINSGTAPTRLDFTLTKATPPAFPAGARVVPRSLTLTPTGGGPMSATLRLRYVDPVELTGPGITEARLGLWKLIDSTWTPQGGVVDAANNHVTLAGITSFSGWGIAEMADLTLAKANSVADAAVVGQPWTWTLSAVNVGTPATFASGQTILSDTLPNANVVYGAVSVENVQNVTGTVVCTIASNDLTCAAAGGAVTFASNVGTSRLDVVLTATPQTVGAFQNPRAGGTAQIDPANLVAESSESNDAAANTVTVAKANTTTTITADEPDPSLSGHAATVHWSVAVNAPGALGAALSGDVTVSDGTVSCMADVSAGQCAITFVTPGAKTLTATYAGDANYNGSASGTVQHTVEVAAPAIAKAFAPASIVVGGTSTVTLTLGNTNGIALTGAQFSDPLANMSAAGGAVTGTCAGTTPNTLSPGDTALAFSGIGIPAGGSCTVIFSVTSSTTGTQPNTTTGVITAQTPSAGAPSNTANLTVSPSADLSITKTDGAAATTQGSPIAYTIVAENGGPSGVTGATVADTFPATLTSCNWSCIGAAGGTCTATGFGHIADTVDLPLDATVTYTVNCTVAPAAVGTIENTATVAAPSGVLDPAAGNNTATDVDTLPPLPDLALTKTHVGNFTRGETGRIYTITVTNTGDGPTNGSTITVTDSVPAGLTPTAASGTGWTCSIASQTVTCTRSGVLNASAAAPPISLRVSVAANAAPLVTNTASVAGGGNVASANDSASDPTTIGSDQLFSNGFE